MFRMSWKTSRNIWIPVLVSWRKNIYSKGLFSFSWNALSLAFLSIWTFYIAYKAKHLPFYCSKLLAYDAIGHVKKVCHVKYCPIFFFPAERDRFISCFWFDYGISSFTFAALQHFLLLFKGICCLQKIATSLLQT